MLGNVPYGTNSRVTLIQLNQRHFPAGYGFMDDIWVMEDPFGTICSIGGLLKDVFIFCGNKMDIIPRNPAYVIYLTNAPYYVTS